MVHFEAAVRPQLEAMNGFVDARLERVEGASGQVELVVVTRWASMEAIRGFAGDQVELAVVEPEARAVLADYDKQVRHIELADDQAFGDLELIDTPGVAAAHEPWSTRRWPASTTPSSGWE